MSFSLFHMARRQPQPQPAYDPNSTKHIDVHIPEPIHKDLPKVNPNALPVSRMIGGLLKEQNFKYIPNHRPVVEKDVSMNIHSEVSPVTSLKTPINPRKQEKFRTALREGKMRSRMGTNITPS